MPRGQRETVEPDEGSQAPTERSRRALGDVSNKESKDTNEGGSKKKIENQTLRRSRRLSNATTRLTDAEESNPADEPIAVARRQPTRASIARTSVNPFAEPLPIGRATRKRASKEVEANDSKMAAPDEQVKRTRTTEFEVSRPQKSVQNKEEFHYKGGSEETPQEVALTGKNMCPDILTTANHGLQRIPFSSKQYTPGIGMHDIENKDDILQVPNYVTDLYQRLFNAEEHTRPRPYMNRQKQPELNGIMRSILVDWLVEVHAKFRLLPETLYLCVNIIDRYLEKKPVVRNRLQLVGVTALLIACKYEEIYPPEVKDCVYITDRAYTRQDVLDMEAEIVKTLTFCLTVPTGHPFLQRFLYIVKASSLVRNLANYYMERMLQEHSALEFKPSLLAATAVCLAHNNPTRIHLDDALLDEQPLEKFPTALLEYTGFNREEIKDAAILMEAKVGEVGAPARSRHLIAVKRKYQATRYDSVAVNFADPLASYLD